MVPRLRNDLEERVTRQTAVEQLTGHGVPRHGARRSGTGTRAGFSFLHQPLGQMFRHPGGQTAIGSSNIAATAAALEFVNYLGLTNRWDPVLQGSGPDGSGVEDDSGRSAGYTAPV